MFGLRVEPHHCNPLGIYHEAVIMAMMDIAFSGAIGHALGKYIVTPTINISLIMETHCTKNKFLQMAKTLDKAARDAGIDFIGGFGALVQKGMTKSDAMLIKALPDVL